MREVGEFLLRFVNLLYDMQLKKIKALGYPHIVSVHVISPPKFYEDSNTETVRGIIHSELSVQTD